MEIFLGTYFGGTYREQAFGIHSVRPSEQIYRELIFGNVFFFFLKSYF